MLSEWLLPDTELRRVLEAVGREDALVRCSSGNGVSGTLIHECWTGVGNVARHKWQFREVKGGFLCRFTKSAPIR